MRRTLPTDTTAEPEARELTDDSGSLDVEVEFTDLPADDTIERPWNPESIRVGSESFSLRNMLDFIDEEAWTSRRTSSDCGCGASCGRGS